MMLAGLITGVILAIKLCPDIPLTDFLRAYLVDAPARWIDGAERHHILCAIIVIGLLTNPEVGILLSVADMSLVSFALHTSLYVDAVVVAATVTALARLKMTSNYVRALVARRIPRHGRNGARRSRTASKKAENDDEEPEIRLAA